MAQPERYFIGPNVREKLTEVFTRVGGMAAGSGGQTPGTWLQDIQRPPNLIRAATFTGTWSIGTTNTVTFKYEPTATQTVTNLSWPVSHNHSAPENCIVGKEGTSWWLVVPVMQSATSIFITGTATATRLTDINISATLNTVSCEISVSKTPVTTSMILVTSTATATYLRLRVP